MNDKGASHPPIAVVLVRPHHFHVNPQTALDNDFQTHGADSDARRAYDEVTSLAEALEAAGVTVHLFEDEGTETPDSVFPNNWFSTHRDGRIALYPMRAANRRPERRRDILDALSRHYRVTEIVDYSPTEKEGRFLEGTGSMILDRQTRTAFAAVSPRTDPVLFHRFCEDFAYRPMLFDAQGASGSPLYHTNVMMALGSGYALAALDMVADADQRRALANRLQEQGRDLITLSQEQISEFAGNAFELAGSDGPVLALSARAAAALDAQQRKRIERHARILTMPVPTIEKSGGSLRCMIAGVHLPR
ncbi:citrulline utilization hydrolase CtlX [Sphingomicrobium lutaoense]|uniref:Amidinotransferase n=1 Tax=Sphingomicrobium lutaoense TaxID=515949 RepID=A0A839YW85_9SPHN|nr:arginine deiminase-related protein [Sphingomicrobium lutaoense]MBB3763459.1 hypothetical protein [Sphingomicrobium lutaoense]